MTTHRVYIVLLNAGAHTSVDQCSQPSLCIQCGNHQHSQQCLVAYIMLSNNEDDSISQRTCSAHVYCELLGGGTSTQATLTGAAGVGAGVTAEGRT